MLIRPALPQETQIMQAIELDAAKSYAALPGYGFSVVLPARSDDEHAFAREHGARFVVDIDGAVGGFIMVIPLDHAAHIFEAAVLAEYQGRGIGKKLVSVAENYAREQGYKEMTLTTYRDVPWNAPFYARLGYEAFVPDGDRPQMRGLIADEVEQGFAVTPRVAMRKVLI